MTDGFRRIAVTGASGYIGSKLLQRLQREPSVEHVLAMDVRSPAEALSARVEFLRHDVTSPLGDVLARHGIEAVAHLAFVLRPGHGRAAIRRVNVDGAANVLDACARASVRHILYLSSTTVYGAHPDNPDLLTEEAPMRPVKGFQYAEDKVKVERLLAAFWKEHPAVTIAVLRACPVMGPQTDNFISRAFTRPVLVGIAGCDPPMQFVHEDDLLDILLRCLLRPVSGTYNVAGDGAIRWSEMAALLGRRVVRLPAPLLYWLTEATWRLRLQSDSPSCGLDFIRYPWVASTERLKRELSVSFRYTSRQVWEAFAAGRGKARAERARA